PRRGEGDGDLGGGEGGHRERGGGGDERAVVGGDGGDIEGLVGEVDDAGGSGGGAADADVAEVEGEGGGEGAGGAHDGGAELAHHREGPRALARREVVHARVVDVVHEVLDGVGPARGAGVPADGAPEGGARLGGGVADLVPAGL